LFRAFVLAAVVERLPEHVVAAHAIGVQDAAVEETGALNGSKDRPIFVGGRI
jgi:hypothetical protein